MAHRVISVLSGDSLVVRPVNATTAGEEKIVSLSSVQAPRLAPRKQSGPATSDEPFALDAREWLRKLCVGKPVLLRIDYTAPSGRPFVSLLLQNNDNVALLGVKAGWLRVRSSSSNDPSELMQALLTAEQEAQAAKLGQWNDDPVVIEQASRSISYTLEQDPRAFLESFKGKPTPGVVEQVRDGSTMRILLTEPMQVITVMLSGIKTPTYRKGVPNMEDLEEPFGEEVTLKHREVKVVLEGVSNNNFLGTVLHPVGNIAEFLVANGLATVLDWTVTMVTGGPQRLREAEKKAQAKRLRLFKNFVPKAKPDVPELDFNGTVTRIISGDTVAVVSDKTGKEIKLTLSSIRQAKPKDPKEAYYNFEAREYLRSKLIGQKVRVTIEYTRPPADGFDERICGTLMAGPINMAEALLSKGLAGLIRHRKDDTDRSVHYDTLMVAEEKAQSSKKGIFSDKEAPVLRITDASENATKARSFLTSFKRSGRVPAVVEFVANAGRFKVYVPKEMCKLTLVLSGVRCPRVARNVQEKSEPFAEEASDFVSKKILQHDVEIEIENVDKTGGFIGSLFKNGQNIGCSLLEEGYATIHSFSADGSSYTNQLYAAENLAKSAKKNVWSLVTEEPEAEEIVTEPANRQKVSISVCEILDGHHFYVQILNDQTAALESLMSKLNIHNKSSAQAVTPVSMRPGDLVSAQFSEDKCWYRARVRRVLPDKSCEVVYIDYGNSETVPANRIKTLGSEFTKLPPQAQESYLSHVRVPSLEDDYGVEAAEMLKELLNKPSLSAYIDAKKGGALYLTIDDEGSEYSVNEVMLRSGFGQVQKGAPGEWKRHEEYARSKRYGMFEFGDFSLDKDDRGL